MTLVKFQPNRSPMTTTFNRLFDEFLPGFWNDSESGEYRARPSVDVVEEEDKVTLVADMPGMDKKDIKVTVSDGMLTIEGSREEERKETKGTFARTERHMGLFSRSFNLPRWADGSKVDASYKNGVLTVTVPKHESARPKEIEVKVS